MSSTSPATNSEPKAGGDPQPSQLPDFQIPSRRGFVLDGAKRVHLLGAGGAGVSGAARLLLNQGHKLSGYDRGRSPFSEPLESIGVQIRYGDSNASSLPEGVQVVIRSAAIPDTDPQVVLARERNLPILKYADVLHWLSQMHRVLAVAGTHGKTSTSWLLHHALKGVEGMQGSGALVGGMHGKLRVNAIPPTGDCPLVLEACEYDRTFLRIQPRGAVITNVEADHLDYYGDLGKIHEAFARFALLVSSGGLLVVGDKVPEMVEEAAVCETWRLGRELQVEMLNQHQGMSTFRLKGPGWNIPKIRMGVPGIFNVENAALAAGLAMGRAARRGLDLTVSGNAIAQSIGEFGGAARRFESWGTVGGVEIVHDYAHHPTEVAVTLDAARRVMPGKPIHVLFQPHQHSRTARFLDEFVQSLKGAARVVVADVYGARAHIDGQAAGAKELVEGLVSVGIPAVHGGSPSQSASTLAAGLQGVSAALVLGAGDIDGIQHELRSALALRCA